MAIKISFYNETDADVEVYEAVIKDIIGEAFKYEQLTGTHTCNYIFVDNKRIKEMNAYYRGKNDITDVLTFEANDDTLLSGCISKNGQKNLGDIFISIDRMIEQAYSYGHGEVREMSFLAVHGFLHLLGYDHLDVTSEKEMFLKQEAILDAKNIRR